MKEITVWLRWNENTKRFQHNHYEYGWAESNKPTVIYPTQQVWKKYVWDKKFCTINENKVIF